MAHHRAVSQWTYSVCAVIIERLYRESLLINLPCPIENRKKFYPGVVEIKNSSGFQVPKGETLIRLQLTTDSSTMWPQEDAMQQPLVSLWRTNPCKFYPLHHLLIGNVQRPFVSLPCVSHSSWRLSTTTMVDLCEYPS